MNDRSFIKHAAVYGLASLLVQAGGFVLLPLYTHYLKPSEYGVLELLGRLAETVGTCLMFGGFRQALLTFYQQSRQETERRRLVATTLSLFGVTSLLGGGLAMAMAGPLSGLLSDLNQDARGISAGLLQLAVLAILLEPLSQIPLTLIQARVESVRFVTITLTQFLVRVGLCVLFVRYLHGGVAGALSATVLMGAIFGLTLSMREVVRSPTRPDLGQLRALLRFALPLVPGGLCFFLLHNGDRFFLLRYCGTEDVGTYALGYKLALAVGMFSLSPLYMVWSAHMYAAAREQDAPVVFGTVFTRILAVYLLVALGLGLFQDEVVNLMSGGASYARASAVVAPVLLAYFFQSAASLMDAGLYVRHRTGLKLGITLVTTVVMLLLYAVLIPRYGSMGAALATLGGFAFLAVRTWVVTQRVFPVHYEWPRLLVLLALTVGLWLVSRILPAAPWVWPVKVGLWMVGPAVAWFTGLMSPHEKEHVRGLIGESRRCMLNWMIWSRTVRLTARRGAVKPPKAVLKDLTTESQRAQRKRKQREGRGVSP